MHLHVAVREENLSAQPGGTTAIRRPQTATKLSLWTRLHTDLIKEKIDCNNHGFHNVQNPVAEGRKMVLFSHLLLDGLLR